jgi:hypothetical protein
MMITYDDNTIEGMRDWGIQIMGMRDWGIRDWGI